MIPFALYCKSYSTDVKRVVRLAKTISMYNIDRIPFFISCPASDIALFREFLVGLDIQLITDEEIIKKNPRISPNLLDIVPGHLSQQIIKSEFWRLGYCQAYLCLDSDCEFIRPFKLDEFIAENDVAYTIIDEGREILLPALAKKKQRVIDNFKREAIEVQDAIGRSGKIYNFGPNCPIWDARVWLSLDTEFLTPQGISFQDLILKIPNEMRWYGESLLKYNAIPILPSQPFFKMYHYQWQLKLDQRDGIDKNKLSQLYCGVVYQSAWEREMDWPKEGGGLFSKIGRRLRTKLGRT